MEGRAARRACDLRFLFYNSWGQVLLVEWVVPMILGALLGWDKLDRSGMGVFVGALVGGALSWLGVLFIVQQGQVPDVAHALLQ